ncbi:MAG TPA: glycosyltransferase [Azospirillaceae bacterium]|nr:glycosyltransferase [Azospirillaceae bacterium]
MNVDMLTGVATEMLRNGRLEEAEKLSRLAITMAPASAEALHVLGLLQRKDGRMAAAVATLRRARRLNPLDGTIWFNLANVLGQSGDAAAMARVLRDMAQVDPASPDLWRWLAVSAPYAGLRISAPAALRRCLAMDPARHDVRQMLLEKLAAEIRADPALTDDAPTKRADQPGQGRISLVICSIDPDKFAKASANFAALLDGSDYELIGVHDARSLCEGYNRGLRRATGDIVIFCHDDIEILIPDFETRLRDRLRRFDMIGVAGTTLMAGATWMHAGWPRQHGQVNHVVADQGCYRCDVYGMEAAVIAPAQALDGLFIAARREAATAVGFDEAAFDGFHLYDMDFSFSAWRAGYRLAVCTDFCVIHASMGRMDEKWRAYAARFLAKHADALPQLPFGPNPLRAARLDTRAQIRAFVAALLTLERGGAALLPGEGPSARQAAAT